MTPQDAERTTAFIRAGIGEAVAVLGTLEALAPVLATVAGAVSAALSNGHAVYACGNGGSAADAQHLTGELLGRFKLERPPLAAVALTTDSSIITAVANDYGYDQVFARQVRGLARAGDVLVAISTSGSSPSVLEAARAAREAGVTVVGMTGSGGAELAALCDHCLEVPSADTPRIQEGHGLLIHLLCACVEDQLFGAGERS